MIEVVKSGCRCHWARCCLYVLISRMGLYETVESRAKSNSLENSRNIEKLNPLKNGVRSLTKSLENLRCLPISSLKHSQELPLCACDDVFIARLEQWREVASHFRAVASSGFAKASRT